MKPLKSQFSQFVQFTTNIEDRIINFHIDNAFYYEIKPVLKDLSDYIQGLSESTLELMPDLHAFYQNHVLRWWILLAYKRFLTNHGRNVTQFGYTKTRDPDGTFEQVSGEERAVILKELQNDINIAKGNLFAELEKVKWTFDGVIYAASDRRQRRKSFGVSAIGGEKDKCGCSTPWYLPTPSTPSVPEGDYSDLDYIPEDYNI